MSTSGEQGSSLDAEEITQLIQALTSEESSLLRMTLSYLKERGTGISNHELDELAGKIAGKARDLAGDGGVA